MKSRNRALNDLLYGDAKGTVDLGDDVRVTYYRNGDYWRVFNGSEPVADSAMHEDIVSALRVLGKWSE